MAKILLEIGADVSQADNGIRRLAETTDKLSSVSKQTQAEIRKGMDEVGKAARKANQEMADPKPTETQKKQLSAVQALKKEIKDLEAAALLAGEGTAEFAKNIALAGQKKAELKDLKEAIAALDPDAVAKSFLGLASSIAGGFSVAQSAIALTGSKSEELEKTLLKVQAAQGLLSGLQQLANTSDELAKVKIIALQKLQVVQTNLQAAAESKNIVVKKAATIAQYALNAAMSLGSGGVLLLVGGIATLVAGLSRLIPETESASEKQERLNKELDKTKELTGALVSTQDAYINLLKEQGKSQEEIDKARTVSAKLKQQQIDDEKKVNAESLKAFQDQLKEQLKEQENYDNKSLRADIKETEAKISELKNRGKVLILQEQQNGFAMQAEQLKEQKEEQENQKQAYDKLVQLRRDFQDSLRDLARRAEQAEIQSLSEEEKIKALAALSQKELEIQKQNLIKKGQAIDKNFKLAEEQQRNFDTLSNEIERDKNQKLLDLQNKSNDELKESIKKGLDEINEKRKEAHEKEYTDLLEASKVKILLTKEGSKARLDAEVEAIEKEAKFKLKELIKIEETTGQKLTNKKKIIELESLEKIQKLRDDFSAKNPFSIGKLLGFNDQEAKKFEAALGKFGSEIQKFASQALESQQKILDGELKANQASVSAKDDKIKSLEDQLREEYSLQREGLANNVDAIKEQIAAEKQARADALAQQQEIIEEKKKLAKIQLAVDSATQISDLVTSSTEIYKSLAGLGPIGIGLAIGTIGLMITSFLAAKAKAVQAINSGSGQGFYKGGYTGDMGETEQAGVVHGREFVSTAKTTKKHRPLLEALHREDYSGLTIADLAPILSGVGSFNTEVLDQISHENQSNKAARETKANETLHAVKALNKNLSKLSGHIMNKPQYGVTKDGKRTETRGNTTRIYKK